MSNESESTGDTPRELGEDPKVASPDVPVVIPPATKVKGPKGSGDAQAPARPAGARPSGRVAGARGSKATTAVPVVVAPSDSAPAADAAAPESAAPTFPVGGAGAPAPVAPEVVPALVPAVPTASDAIPSFTPTPVKADAAGDAEPAPKKGKAAVTATASTSAGPKGERRTKVSISHISPWSVMKLSFLLSIAIGIGIVVVFYVFWTALDKAEVFVKVNDLIVEIAGDNFFPLLEYVKYDRVMSLAVLLAVADIVIITLLSTLGAVIYNLVSNLVGGLHITLTDE